MFRDWRTLDPEEHDRLGSVLTFTDAEGYRFMIPAFLTAALRSAYKDLDAPPLALNGYEYNPSIDYLFINTGNLTETQSGTLARYLSFVLETQHFRSWLDTDVLERLYLDWAERLSALESTQWRDRWHRVCKSRLSEDDGDQEVLFYYTDPKRG